MLIIVGRLDIEPDDREEYLEQSDEVARASRAEAGCYDYQFSADRLDPGRINVYERWEDWPSVKAHIRSDHIAAYREAVSGLRVINRSFMQYEIASEKAFG